MRRYWRPVAPSSGVTDWPIELRILCENLVLFHGKKAGRVYYTSAAATVVRRCIMANAKMNVFAVGDPAGVI
jgi:hypothetical protein